MGPLFPRNKADANVLLNFVADYGLAMTRDAVEYSSEMLSDDWISLFAMSQNCIRNLSNWKNWQRGLFAAPVG
jgi:hypothetical protein